MNLSELIKGLTHEQLFDLAKNRKWSIEEYHKIFKKYKEICLELDSKKTNGERVSQRAVRERKNRNKITIIEPVREMACFRVQEIGNY